MFVLFSCKDRKKEFEKQILGDWNLARIDDDLQEEKDLEYVFRNDGFIFKDSGNLIEKRGFHDFNYKYSCLEKATLYKGDSTKYEIVNDHLKIFNLSYKTWDNYRIVSITSDSLVLEKEKGTNFIYYKSHYKIDADENYDRIIVSSSGCHGSCPMLNIEINKNGNVIYYGEYYNTKNGFYTLSISNKKYQNIEESFKKANIKNLKNFYSEIGRAHV